MKNTFPEFQNLQGYVKIGRSLSTGDLVFLPQISENRLLEIPSSVSEKGFEYLYFDPFLMFNELLNNKEMQKILFILPECYGFFPKEQYADICFPAELIFNEFHNKNAHYEDAVRGLLLSLISLIVRNLPKENRLKKSDSQIQSALLFIHNNYAAKLSIADIARDCCNMSESHFRRKFGEIMHISPLDYINALRIHKACQLIYHSEMHINEIALSVGFTTLSSFNRQFLALMGISPTNWRKTHISPVSQIHYTVTNS